MRLTRWRRARPAPFPTPFRDEHRPPASLRRSVSSDGVDPDRAVVVFFRAAVANVGGDRPIDDTVHHHVGIFRVHPDVDPFDLEDFSGLDPDHEFRVRLHRELESFRTQHLRPLAVHPDAVLEVVGGDDQLRIVDGGLPQALEQVLDRHRDDPDVLPIVAVADARSDPVGILDHRVEQKNAFGRAAGEEKNVATCSGFSMR